MVATPAGSTAYNLSAHGPILPLDAPLLALTPVSPFRPRRWRGALIPDKATVRFDILEPDKRPVNVAADHTEFKSVVKVLVSQSRGRRPPCSSTPAIPGTSASSPEQFSLSSRAPRSLEMRHDDRPRAVFDPDPRGRQSASTSERPSPASLQSAFLAYLVHALPSGARRQARDRAGRLRRSDLGRAARCGSPGRTARPRSSSCAPGRNRDRPSLPAGRRGVALSCGCRHPSLSERACRLEHFWGAQARRMADWVSEGRSLTEVAARLETALCRAAPVHGGRRMNWPRVIFEPDRRLRSLCAAISSTGFPIGLGMSERTLRRYCHEAFGYGPKTLRPHPALPALHGPRPRSRAPSDWRRSPPKPAMPIRRTSRARHANSPASRRARMLVQLNS